MGSKRGCAGRWRAWTRPPAACSYCCTIAARAPNLKAVVFECERNTIPEVLPVFEGLTFALLQPSDFAVLIDLLATDSNARILSSPRLVASNNQEAALRIGDAHVEVLFASVLHDQVRLYTGGQALREALCDPRCRSEAGS